MLVINPMRMHGIDSLCKNRIIGGIEDMGSFIALFSKLPNRSSRIVCIRVQWNHSALSWYAPRVGSGNLILVLGQVE